MGRIVTRAALTTERLLLRELTAADAPFVLALLNEPSFIAHIGDRGVRTLDGARDYIANGPWTRYAVHGFGLWLVERRDPAEPIGVCGLIKRDTLPDPDIGFAFRPAFWSQGYAFEAACAVKTYARDVLHVPQLLAIVSPSNGPSIRLLGKLGFQFERITRLTPHGDDIALYAARFDRL